MASKALASLVAGTILLTELLRDDDSSPHLPHLESGDGISPGPDKTGQGGFVPGRLLTFVNNAGEPLQFLGRDGHPWTFIANGKPNDLDGLELFIPGNRAESP